ncbi:MAG: hypothetical protein ACOY7U_10005 [Acidobacteriota bacterium]
MVLMPLGQATLEARLTQLEMDLFGEREMARRNEPTLPGIRDRVVRIVSSIYTATASATGTQKQGYEIAANQFEKFLSGLRQLVTTDLPALEPELEKAGAPHTPGRFPEWHKE